MDLKQNVHTFVAYMLKACAILALVFALSKTLPLMPAVAVAVFWAVLASVSTAGVMYQVVVRKTHRQFKLINGGFLARINNGRALSLTISFIVSTVCMGSLLLESPKWDLPEWLLMVVAVFLFFAVALIVRRIIGKEYEKPFQKAGVVLVSCAIVGLLLCCAYIAICAVMPAEHYETLLQAFLKTSNPFENSGCALLSEAGIFAWLSDACTKFFVAKTYTVFQPVYLVLRAVLCAGAFFGFANLLGICYLNRHNFARIFLPLEVTKAECGGREHVCRPLKRYVFVSCLLPILLVCGFLYANNYAEQVQETQTNTHAQTVARSVASQAVYVKDGKYYDKEMVDKLLLEASENNEEGSAKSLRNLAEGAKSAIEATYNSCLNDVNSFLDWYFNLPSDENELKQLNNDKANTAAREKFLELVVVQNTSRLDDVLSNYMHELDAFTSTIDAKVKACEITNVPKWLLVCEDFPLSNSTFALVDGAQNAKDKANELGISADTGSNNASVVQQNIGNAVFNTSEFAKVTENISSAADKAGSVLNVLNIVNTQFIDQASNRNKYKSAFQRAIVESRDVLLDVVSL